MHSLKNVPDIKKIKILKYKRSVSGFLPNKEKGKLRQIKQINYKHKSNNKHIIILL